MLIHQRLTMLKRHVEEAFLIKPKFVIDSPFDPALGCFQGDGIEGERLSCAAIDVSGDLIAQNNQCELTSCILRPGVRR